jgi:hypothetical protein
MLTYDDSFTLGEARARYFAENGFGDDGGYHAPWVRLRVGPLPFYLPNIQARAVAVPYHDAHHILTNYETTWAGEGEVAIWEIGSGGCAHHWEAWLVNLHAVAIGVMLHPRRMWRAFLYGRRCSNLYRVPFDDALLTSKLGPLRRRLRLENAVEQKGLGSYALFAMWSMLGVFVMLVTVALCIFIITMLLAMVFHRIR